MMSKHSATGHYTIEHTARKHSAIERSAIERSTTAHNTRRRDARRYNEKLSPAINAQLTRRANVIAFEKRMFAFAAILITLICILLGTSIKAFASSAKVEQPLQKYYTSIQVEKGDTVWSIAQEYTADNQDADIASYVDEVCSMNQLQDGQIHTGQYLTIAYYSPEIH